MAVSVRVCMEPKFGAHEFHPVRFRIAESRSQYPVAMDDQAGKRSFHRMEPRLAEVDSDAASSEPCARYRAACDKATVDVPEIICVPLKVLDPPSSIRTCPTRGDVLYTTLFGTVSEVVKQRHAVGFSPDTDLSGILNLGVIPFEGLLAVVGDGEVAALEIHAQCMPLVGRNLHICALTLHAAPVDCVVNRDVVFKRVGARNVVVVCVLGAPDYTACLVFFSRDWFELHLYEAVLDARVVFQADREVAVPDCFKTFGPLGAVGSRSMVHFGLPVPVLVAVQPGGAAPVGRLSKLTV